MVLPIALVVVAAILITKGFTGASLSDIINGTIPADEPDTSTDARGTTTTPGVRNTGPIPSTSFRTKAVVIDGKPVAGWIAPIVLWARAHGWTGVVTSGIRTDAEQKQACINVCGNSNGCPGRCAEPGKSNHRGTIFPLGAVDVSNETEFAVVLKGYPGGAPLINDLPEDRVHFSYTGH